VAKSEELRPNYYKVVVMATLANGNRQLVTVECFDLIDAAAKKDFYLGNVWKYLFRLGRKSTTETDDVQKVRTFLGQYEERSMES